LDEGLVAAVLDDWHTAPVSEKLRAMLGFLEKLTLHPGELGPEDTVPLRQAGVNQKAAEEALYICFLFNLMDRVADAFDFEVPSPQSLLKDGRTLFKIGYRGMSIPG
jgi:alkylhydroperoxidase family enzyme